jgi:hypothetical protein
MNNPTPEMIDAYIQDQLPWMDNTDRLRILQGIAIYKHLDSPASDEWRQQHGFIKQD